MDRIQEVLNNGCLKEITKRLSERKNSTAVFGLNPGLKTLILSRIKNFLFVVEDDAEAYLYCDFLAGYGVKSYPIIAKSDNLIYKEEINNEKLFSRIEGLTNLASGGSNIILTVESLKQYYENKEYFIDSSIKLKINEKVNREEIISSLVKLGYKKEIEISGGDFSVRGNILDIFPSGSSIPVRLTLDDDTIQKIRYFSLESGLALSSTEEIDIKPVYEYDYSKINLPLIRKKFIEESKSLSSEAKEKLTFVIDEVERKISDGTYDTSLSWALPFNEDKKDIFSYLDESTVIVFDGYDRIMEKADKLDRENSARVEELYRSGEVLKEHRNIVLTRGEIEERLKDFIKLDFSAFNNGSRAISVSSPTVPSYFLDFKLLISDIEKLRAQNYNILLCFGDKERAELSVQSFLKEGINANFISKENIFDSIYGLNCSDSEIKKGFIDPVSKFALIGSMELVREKRRLKQTKKGLAEIPKIGDIVVHEIHGIGRCSGFQKIVSGGIGKEYVVIEYLNEDKLYVPIDQMTRLSKYSGSNKVPKLSKIGGKSFEKIKENVKAKIKEMAINLLELYSKREKAKGFVYPKDDFLQKQFEDSFPFVETPDQLQAVEDIKRDMEKGKVMDRLICGDVGYGKTEVALRAVFKTVTSSKQAAILVPTTILAKQHFNTVNSRMENFGVKTAILTRLQKSSEAKKILEDLAEGKIDVLVSTHRMLSSDVCFKDLGLLVLDEEQRFGVEHKEKIKELKTNLNVLTMSATPIPRTLNMALSGIRDISVLETSPKNRLPIDTYVTEYSDALIKDAITRELERDGQVFLLYNKVRGIEEFASFVSELVPFAKIIVTHGRLAPEELDKRINDFYDKKGNVLITTTIIENGIDMPDANTLIVIDSDKLGLNSMYQLRGRVGRSAKLAKAYFTVERGKPLTKESESRLQALMQNTELGSGFKIAMADLEIRGAGDLLGKEQSGHIAEIGYEMYCKLLSEAVDESSGGETVKFEDTEIAVDLDAYIDSTYIENQSEKLKYYKKAAEVSDSNALEGLILELDDLYGKPPLPLLNLLKICLVKNLASKIGVKKVSINKNGASLIFSSKDCFNNKAVICALENFKEGKFSSTEPITLEFDFKTDVRGKLDALSEFLIKAAR